MSNPYDGMDLERLSKLDLALILAERNTISESFKFYFREERKLVGKAKAVNPVVPPHGYKG